MASFVSRRPLVVTLAGLMMLFIGYRAFLYLNRPSALQAERRARALAVGGEIHIAAVWPRAEHSHFFNGIQLAVNQVTKAGRPSGRPLIVHEYDEPSPREGMRTARSISRERDIVAVIGHYWRESALNASITYENSGICFLATGTTSTRLCNHRFRYVIQPLPDDLQLAGDLAAALVARGVKTLAVLSVRSLYGDNLSSAMIEAAIEAGIQVTYSAAYSSRQTDFLPIIAEVGKTEPECVVVIDEPPRVRLLLVQMGKIGVKTTVIGGPELESPSLAEAIEGTKLQLRVLSTFWAGDSPRPLQQFVADYTARFGVTPTSDAAHAYEAVQLIVQAIERLGTAAPLSLATVLRYGGEWQCLVGPCSFSTDGRIVGHRTYFMMVKDNQFTEDSNVDGRLRAGVIDHSASGNTP